MTQSLSTYDKYLADFKTFEQGLPSNGASWAHPLREQALSRFRELGFPTARRGNERWKYTNVKAIADATFSYPLDAVAGTATPAQVRRAAPLDDSWTTLAFVDGRYSSELSEVQTAGGIRAMSLAEAMSSERQLVEKHLGRYAPAQDDGFTSLNTAYLRDGAFVHIPADHVAEAPVQLLFIMTEGTQPTVTYPRTLVVAGRHSRVTLIETYASLSEDRHFTNAVAEVVAEEGAGIEHYRVMLDSPNAFHIGTTRVLQERDSTFRSVSFALGAALGRNDLHVLLDGPGSECTLNGLYMTSGRQHIDNHISITHAKPHATSHQYYKGILAGRSRAVFSGRVLVEKDAQKTYADQKDKNLLLSRGAEIDTKPSLEIFADDVQCFHGATAGQVDRETLFYMRSRGIDLETAAAMLIRAFAAEILDTVRPAPLHDHIEMVIDRQLPGFQLDWN